MNILPVQNRNDSFILNNEQNRDNNVPTTNNHLSLDEPIPEISNIANELNQRNSATQPNEELTAKNIQQEGQKQRMLSLNIQFTDLVNIVSGLIGICVATSRYMPKLSGIIMALPSGIISLLITKFPQGQLLSGMCMCFLAGIVGSKNYREFIIGYLLSCAICKAMEITINSVTRFTETCKKHIQHIDYLCEYFFTKIMNILSNICDIFHWNSLDDNGTVKGFN